MLSARKMYANGCPKSRGTRWRTRLRLHDRPAPGADRRGGTRVRERRAPTAPRPAELARGAAVTGRGRTCTDASAVCLQKVPRAAPRRAPEPDELVPSTRVFPSCWQGCTHLDKSGVLA